MPKLSLTHPLVLRPEHLANLPMTKSSLRLSTVSPGILEQLLVESKKQTELTASIEAKFNLPPEILVLNLEKDWLQPTSLDKIMPIRLQQNLAILAHIHHLNGDLQAGLKQVDLVLDRSAKEASKRKFDADKYLVRAQERRNNRANKLKKSWTGKV